MSKSLETIIKSLLIFKDEWKVTIIKEWHLIFGDLAKYATVEKIENDTLFLGVFDASWLQELHGMAHELIAMINSHLKGDYIKRIKLKQITQKKRIDYTMRVTPSPLTVRTVVMNEKQEKALQIIPDKELQKSLRQFFIRCEQERI